MVVCEFKYTWDFASPYYESIQSSNGAVADIGDTAKIYKQRFREVCDYIKGPTLKVERSTLQPTLYYIILYYIDQPRGLVVRVSDY